EEELACATHKKLREKFPALLTIITPRHAVRGNEIAEYLKRNKCRFARRSKKETITANTEIYLADTMGELGLFYRLCPITALGGSFTSVGGHNPIEPAQLNSAIIFGPYMFNFAAMAREFAGRNAALHLHDNGELADAVERLLANPIERAALTAAAH